MEYFFANILPLLFLLLFLSVITINSLLIYRKIERIPVSLLLFEESNCGVRFLSSKRMGAYMGLIKVSLTRNGNLFLRPPMLLLPFLAKSEQRILFGLNLRFADQIYLSETNRKIVLKFKDRENGRMEVYELRVKDNIKLLGFMKEFNEKRF